MFFLPSRGRLLSVLLRLVVLLYGAPSGESRKWYKLTRQKFSRDRHHRSAIPTFANNLPPGRISLPVEKISLFYKNIVNRISLALQPKGKEDNFLTTFEHCDRFFPFYLPYLSGTLKDLIISQPVIFEPYFIMLVNFVQKRIESVYDV